MATHARDIEVARNHIFHRQYMDNALEALGKNEPGKAGESIWGSITQAVHTVDAWRGPDIDDHRRLMNFARDIGREIGDPAYPKILDQREACTRISISPWRLETK